MIIPLVGLLYCWLVLCQETHNNSINRSFYIHSYGFLDTIEPTPPPHHLGRGIRQPAAIQIQLRGTEVSGQELREGLAWTAHETVPRFNGRLVVFPQPIWKKCASQIGFIFPNFWGENKK